jgi:23S rRNA (uracil1939-C5)-methyltransferase
VLDLYGGTGAIALRLAADGHHCTMVESYPPAASLATRAAQAQRLTVEVVTGDVASVSRALAVAKSRFDLVVANPPRRGLSPAAREAIAAMEPKTVLYVACDLDNLSRDVDHLARLGYGLDSLTPIDMLPLTEEVEVLAVLSRGERPAPHVLYDDGQVVALDKPPHEPVQDQDEYPTSLVTRARAHVDGGEWHTVLKVEASTSGVTLFARTRGAAERWSEAIAKSGRLVYLAAARGVTPAKGAITRELRGEHNSRSARTRYRRLAIGGGHSVLRVVPEKRYVHQIRRHLAAIGHPVLGDARYGHPPTNRYFEEKHGLDRSFLHLVRVEVEHPDSGNRLLIEAPLPADLRAALVRASDDSVLRFLENKRALGGAPRRRDDGAPFSERSPLSERGPASVAEVEHGPSSRGGPPPSLRGGEVLDFDDAPRTVRGELLTPDED